jgi:Leucine-rich repeat (LRR) protein
LPVLGIWEKEEKIRLKEPSVLDIKNFKEPPSFMKELEKTQQGLRQLFEFLKKLKSTVIYNNQVSDF